MCNLVFMVINEGEAEAVKIIEDRQTDRQTVHVYLIKLHGWETLAKIKNNRCLEGHSKGGVNRSKNIIHISHLSLDVYTQ